MLATLRGAPCVSLAVGWFLSVSRDDLAASSVTLVLRVPDSALLGPEGSGYGFLGNSDALWEWGLPVVIPSTYYRLSNAAAASHNCKSDSSLRGRRPLAVR